MLCGTPRLPTPKTRGYLTCSKHFIRQVQNTHTEKKLRSTSAVPDPIRRRPCRRAITAKSHSSSIFSSGESSRPGTGGSVSRSNNIFGGGAYADDAVSVPKMKIPRAMPSMDVDAGGALPSARDRRDAALRGSGGLW